jgi:hypothetical protein
MLLQYGEVKKVCSAEKRKYSTYGWGGGEGGGYRGLFAGMLFLQEDDRAPLPGGGGQGRMRGRNRKTTAGCRMKMSFTWSILYERLRRRGIIV